MDPVIGVAKGESQVQAFLQRKKIYKQSFKFTHDLPGLHTFHRFYQELEKVSGQPPAIIFESIGHYHKPVISFEARKTSLRQVKTDKADAYHLGELYYKEEHEIYRRKQIKLLIYVS